jgi:hypothetical protein
LNELCVSVVRENKVVKEKSKLKHKGKQPKDGGSKGVKREGESGDRVLVSGRSIHGPPQTILGERGGVEAD